MEYKFMIDNGILLFPIFLFFSSRNKNIFDNYFHQLNVTYFLLTIFFFLTQDIVLIDVEENIKTTYYKVKMGLFKFFFFNFYYFYIFLYFF